MLEFGVVIEQDEERHAVKVRDLDYQITIPWLTVGVDFAGTGVGYNLPPVDSTVAYIRYKNAETINDICGIVLRGVITTPGVSWGDKDYRVFIRVSDTQLLQYNTSNGKWDLFGSDIELKADTILANSPDVQLGQSPTEVAVLGGKLKTYFDTLVGTSLITGALGKTSVQLKALGQPGIDAEITTLLGTLTGILATQVKVK